MGSSVLAIIPKIVGKLQATLMVELTVQLLFIRLIMSN